VICLLSTAGLSTLNRPPDTGRGDFMFHDNHRLGVSDLLSQTIEEVILASRVLAKDDPFSLENLAQDVECRIQELDAIYNTNFRRFCEQNPLVQYWEGLEFFSSAEQRLEHRHLCDLLSYIHDALRGDAHQRILVRRKLKKAGVPIPSQDMPFFRLIQIAEKYSVSV
jgi:hypothetical protein